MDTSTALTKLNVEINDGDNFTFSQAEKERAIERAFNDRYVVDEVYDSSITYDSSTQAYTLPTNMRNIMGIGQDPNEDGFETELDSGAYDIKANQIHIKSQYKDLLSTGKPLYIWGWNKVTSADSITDALLQEYVLKLAIHNTLEMLKTKAANRFLKNDTSISEILNLSSQFKREVQEYRQQHRAIPQEI